MKEKIKTTVNNFFKKNPRLRLWFPWAAGFIFLLIVFWFYNSMAYVKTDNAFVDGHAITISAKVSAEILKIAVDDNQYVEKNAVLVELDKRDYQVLREMAAAELNAAEAEVDQARTDVERYTILSKTDEVSKQQLDRALLRLRTANAKAAEVRARIKQTDLELSYTKITAPSAGYVTRKTVEEGSYLQKGQPIMAIVPTEKWVIANFKETELTRIKPGQKVIIKIDTYPGKSFKGHVDSIQDGTGARFSLFPPENATGNYVKVVQRIPVKIVFDENPEPDYRLALGMSVVPKVKVR
ncbi:HlyD family secretion protein [Omnitrophica bacterium]|nr:HlyD family secretion protein [Candidatus Omnitrophota bacterium]